MKKAKLLFAALASFAFAAFATAQNVDVYGVVSDSETGEPIMGAIVQLQGDSQQYSMTDLNGNYSLSAHANAYQPLGKQQVWGISGSANASYRQYRTYSNGQPATLRPYSLGGNLGIRYNKDQWNLNLSGSFRYERAQAGAFVASLPRGIDTPVGACGSRISGGQRQRIAIARALYRQSDVLFLDEATAALDDRTEEALLRSLDDLAREHPGWTLLMIAHRAHSLIHCRRILDLGNGD